MRMQLKISDSTTGLSDKDVKKLTVVKHTIPRDFEDLSKLLENFAGVTGLVFGAASPLTSMLKGWVRFLTKSGGTHVSSLRQLAFADASAPSRVGWISNVGSNSSSQHVQAATMQISSIWSSSTSAKHANNYATEHSLTPCAHS